MAMMNLWLKNTQSSMNLKEMTKLRGTESLRSFLICVKYCGRRYFMEKPDITGCFTKFKFC